MLPNDSGAMERSAPLRRVAVLTTSRADYGLLRPLIAAIAAHDELELRLLVSGSHLCPGLGRTIDEILRDGFPIAERVEVLLASDTPQGIAKAMGLATMGFAQVYASVEPDVIVALGDRYEMFAAVAAAAPFRIPVVHLYGGEVTTGALDDSFRHGMTKLSHLHCVSTEAYARRVGQLGEEPWRIHVTGALSLDNARLITPLDPATFLERFGIPLEEGFLLVSYHSATLEDDLGLGGLEAVLEALDRSGRPVLATMPNADHGGAQVGARLREFAQSRPHVSLVDNLGAEGYMSAMARAAAMVGNSSSGIVEAASFSLPVINVGSRQEGRVRAANVVDVPGDADAIARAIAEVTSPEFLEGLEGLINPFGDGHAVERILDVLTTRWDGAALLTKRFVDAPGGAVVAAPEGDRGSTNEE